MLAEKVSRVLDCPVGDVIINLPYVVTALEKKGILDKPTLIAAIATIGVETGGFKPVTEFGGAAYFNKLYGNRRDLGNVQREDGFQFRGRGFIQITGRANYKLYGTKLGVDLEYEPYLALLPGIGAKILALYFVDRKIPELAREKKWKAVRRAVNGGLNGFEKFSRFVNQLEQVVTDSDLNLISSAEARSLGLNLNPKLKHGGKATLRLKPGLTGMTLKASTLQSSELADIHKYKFAAEEPPIPVASWEIVADLKTGEYYKIVLDGVAINGQTVWYAFSKYCEIIEEPTVATMATAMVTERRDIKFEDIASGEVPGLSEEELRVNKAIAIKTQELLIQNKLLAHPADGAWGPKSNGALRNYQKLRGINESGLGLLTAKSLYQVAYKNLIEGFTLNGDWASRTIMWMKLNDFHISTLPGEINIVYFRGLDHKGVWNGNEDFVFNDRRTIIRVIHGVPKFEGNWLATVDPGREYWFKPLNSKGCANIAAGQYQAWSVGMHKDQRALIQTGDVLVFRGKRKIPDRGNGFGINQHTVGARQNFSVGNAIGFWSAGCCVGAAPSEHYYEFMPLVEQDAREKASPGRYRHFSAIVPGDAFLSTLPR